MTYYCASLPAPHRGDAQQIRVEAHPAVVPEIQHDAARREIVRADSRAPGIEDGREKREVRLDPRGPWRRLGGCGGLRFFGRSLSPREREEKGQRGKNPSEGCEARGGFFPTMWRRGSGEHDGGD